MKASTFPCVALGRSSRPPAGGNRRLEAPAHRRFVKTHLPVDALVFSPKAKYLYIGRDGRDVLFSMYNHHVNANEQWYQGSTTLPGSSGADRTTDRMFGDISTTWLETRRLSDLVAVGERRALVGGAPSAQRHAGPLQCAEGRPARRDARASRRSSTSRLRRAKWPAILDHCSFDYMKAHADQVAPGRYYLREGGGKSFIDRASTVAGAMSLTPDDIKDYEARAQAELGPECARWLAHGG